jgi:hypothetical protein
MNEMTETLQIKPTKPLSQLRPPDSKSSLSHEQVRKIAQEPIQNALPVASEIIANILAQMNMHVVCTLDNLGFITSDHPCIMFDPLFSSEWLPKH